MAKKTAEPKRRPRTGRSVAKAIRLALKVAFACHHMHGDTKHAGGLCPKCFIKCMDFLMSTQDVQYKRTPKELKKR